MQFFFFSFICKFASWRICSLLFKRKVYNLPFQLITLCEAYTSYEYFQSMILTDTWNYLDKLLKAVTEHFCEKSIIALLLCLVLYFLKLLLSSAINWASVT